MRTKVRTASLLLLAVLVPAALFASGDRAQPCATCHACARPTAADPCLGACPRHGGAAQASGPGTVVLSELENLYEPVSFNHRVHAQMASLDNGCVSCHHASPADTYPACKACHSPAIVHEPGTKPGLKGAYHRQCMGCHQEWSAENECEACHALKANRAAQGDTYVVARYKPCQEPDRQVFDTESGAGEFVTFFHRNHSSLYGNECGDCHRQDPCVSCHYQGEKAPRPAGSAAVTHGKCAACHDTEEITGCEKCHADTAREAPFHAWPLGETHVGLDCTDCHDGKPFTAAPDCSACHEESLAALLAKKGGR